MSPPVCAAPGCGNPVPRPPGRRGRPAIYCSPHCRASRRRQRPALSVELEQVDAVERSGADWTVRLHRGSRAVVVARGIGRLSATALAGELRRLLEPPRATVRTDRVDMRNTPDAHEGVAME